MHRLVAVSSICGHVQIVRTGKNRVSKARTQKLIVHTCDEVTKRFRVSNKVKIKMEGKAFASPLWFSHGHQSSMCMCEKSKEAVIRPSSCVQGVSLR